MSDAVESLLRQADHARREDRWLDARRELAKAVALCRRAGPPRLLRQALTALGKIERDLGQGEAALGFYEEAAALCRAEDDALALAHTLRHLGDIHQDAGRLEQAEPCYVEALAIYRGHGQTPPLDLANALRPLAILKDQKGEVAEASRLWEEARDLYAAVEVSAGVEECSSRLGASRSTQ
jgi:tetratricopeptide (TPR) repeat protein